MKKTYMKPATQIVAIRKNDVIATSAKLYNGDTEVGTLNFYNDEDFGTGL